MEDWGYVVMVVFGFAFGILIGFVIADQHTNCEKLGKFRWGDAVYECRRVK